MTVAEFIAELEARAKVHRQIAKDARERLPRDAVNSIELASVAESMHALGLEEAARLARELEQ